MAKVGRAARKSIVTQFTTLYDCDERKSISEWTTRQTLKWMGYSNRRPCQAPLLSAKNRNLRLKKVTETEL